MTESTSTITSRNSRSRRCSDYADSGNRSVCPPSSLIIPLIPPPFPISVAALAFPLLLARSILRTAAGTGFL